MGNRIKRNSVLIIAETLTNNSVFNTGEIIGSYKDSNKWITTDSEGKKWQILINHLRNDNYFKIINQYSMEDIIYYLQSKSENYLTVMWEILVKAVETTFVEIRVTCIDDIYKYISSYLI